MALLLLFISCAIVLSAALALAGYQSKAIPSAAVPSSRFERVLVIGATGGTGRQLVAQALERGYAVTALVRDPSKLRIDHPRLSVIKGDVLDARSVEAAMRDQEAVLCALGHKRFYYPTRILSEGTRNIIRAMETHSVERLICETSLGIGNSAGRMGLYYTFFVVPVVLAFYFWDKTRQEQMIAKSDVEWVIIRPGVLTNGDKRGRYRHGDHVGNFLWTVHISRADVADFMLNQLSSDMYRRTAAGVCY